MYLLGMALHHMLMAALCPVVISCDGFHLVQNEASSVRGGSYTYPEKVACTPLLSFFFLIIAILTCEMLSLSAFYLYFTDD